MSHLLDIIEGKATFARMEGTPAAWHGLGQIITPAMTVEQLQETALVNFTVEKVPNYHYCLTNFDENGSPRLVQAGDYAMIRSDTGEKFANVAERYQPVQPHTIVKFFYDLAKKHDLQIETIGALKGGRTVWAMARTGKTFTLAGGDVVAQYCLLSTSYDKTMATRVGFTSVRVVCNNTLQFALRDSKSFISVPHSTNFDADQVAIDLGIVAKGWSNFGNIVTELSTTKIDDKKALSWLVDIMEGKGADVEKLPTRKANRIKSVYDKFKGQGIGANLVSADGTAWGLLNAVTEYYDHDYGRSEENRFNAGQFGVGATAKDNALEYIVETLELNS